MDTDLQPQPARSTAMTAPTHPLLRQIRRLVLPPASHSASDALLLGSFLQHNDEEAFAALVARHGPMVLGVCRRVLGNRHEAEDAAQACFVVLARKAAAIRRPETLAAWLHRTARRLALAARRSESRRLQRQTRYGTPQQPADPLEEISVRELLVIVDEEVQRLPERYRLPVILCCLEERTLEEAAQQLGRSSGSLRGRLLRGRSRLRARLIRRGVTLAAVPLVLGGLPAGFLTRALQAIPPCSHGGIAPGVLLLAEEAMKSMAMARMRWVISLVLLLGVAAAGVGTLGRHRQIQQPPQGDPPAPPAAAATTPGSSQGRTDAFGDPLPDGAAARLGKLRWRHGGLTTAVQFAPDCKSLLTIGFDGLRVWDVRSGQSRHQLPNQAGRALDPGILSADGKQVVTVDLNRTVNRLRLWDVASGRLLRAFGDHPCVAGFFSPDGKVLAALGSLQPGDPRCRAFTDVISLWDLTTGKRIRSWKANHGGVYCGTFTADGKTLITGGADRALRFWNASSGAPERQLHGSARPIGHLVLSADDKYLAAISLKTDPAGILLPSGLAWSADNYLALWDVSGGKAIYRFSLPTRKDRGNPGFHMATFLPDGKTLLGVGSGPLAHCWDLATGKEVRSIEVGSPVWSAALSADGKTLATLGLSSTRLFDLQSGKELTPTGSHHGSLQHTLLTPDGQTAITAAAAESDILVWDTATGRERYRLSDRGRFFADLLLAADGRTLYARDLEPGTDPDGSILVWDLLTGKRRSRLPPHPLFKIPNLHCLKLAPDGKTLALAEPFGRVVCLLRSTDGKETGRIGVPEPGVSFLAFTPDSRSLVVVCSDGSVHTYDVAGGGKLAELPAWGYAMMPGQRVALTGRDALALSPDGKWLARVKVDGSPVLMERETGALAPLPRASASGINLFAFNPDSRTLAWSARLDSAIHLVEVAGGQERRTLTGHRGPVESLAFSRDGRLLISGSEDSTALVWKLFDQPGATVQEAELSHCWEDLASERADRAYQAMQALVGTPRRAVPQLSKRLRPVAGVERAEITRLLADLESDEFRVREKAATALRERGERAEPALRAALKGELSLEARKRVEALLDGIKAGAAKPQSLRLLRAVEVLEQIGTPAAQQVLTSLAQGIATAHLTQEARASLARLAERSRTKP
jgi:RNA polymerase sigma factor (sigma-70 family)